MILCKAQSSETVRHSRQSGFGIAEFLVSALILLMVSSCAFAVIAELQRKAAFQAEAQSVLDNTRLALQVVGRHIRQAGNDPHQTGFEAISIISETELRVRTDITGSAASQKGDPDGDTDDPNESITIRHNAETRSLEIVPAGGSAQIIAGSIAGLSLRCYDALGQPAASGAEVRRINVTISGTSAWPDPETHRLFGVRLSSDFRTAQES